MTINVQQRTFNIILIKGMYRKKFRLSVYETAFFREMHIFHSKLPGVLISRYKLLERNNELSVSLIRLFIVFNATVAGNNPYFITNNKSITNESRSQYFNHFYLVGIAQKGKTG